MLVIGATLIAVPFAAAVPTIYFDVGNNGSLDGTVVDETLGDGALGTPGTVFSIFNSLGFKATTTASTKPAAGTATKPELSSVSLNVEGNGTIAIYFVETLFGPTSQAYAAELAVNDLLTPSVSTQYYSYAQIGLFTGVFAGVGSPMTTLSQVGGGNPSTTGTLPFNGAANTFTLIQKVVVTQGSKGKAQITATLTNNVPDGGTTLALLGASLLGLGAVRRKLTK